MASVTYKHQPGIGATNGTVPLAGTSHPYEVSKVLWDDEVEVYLASKLIGYSLHVCSGMSQLGDVRLDLFQPNIDVRADAARLPFSDQSFDTTIADVPYNGKFAWMHSTINELIRVTRKRIIWQHWFMPINKRGQLKKCRAFQIRETVMAPTLDVHKSEIRPALFDPETKTYWAAEEIDRDYFSLTEARVWQPVAYFGRAQIISVFDREEME